MFVEDSAEISPPFAGAPAGTKPKKRNIDYGCFIQFQFR
jgi:hypothetical protein